MDIHRFPYFYVSVHMSINMHRCCHVELLDSMLVILAFIKIISSRYIDGINKRRAEGKQTSRLGQTNVAGLKKPGLASWKHREAINEILASQKTGHVEADPEEEKDDYFSDASEEL